MKPNYQNYALPPYRTIDVTVRGIRETSNSDSASFLEVIVEGEEPVEVLTLDKSCDVREGDRLRAYIDMRSDKEKGLPEPEGFARELKEMRRVHRDRMKDAPSRYHHRYPNEPPGSSILRIHHEERLREYSRRRSDLLPTEQPVIVEVYRRGPDYADMKLAAVYELNPPEERGLLGRVKQIADRLRITS